MAVDIPPELEEAMADHAVARAAFDAMPMSHRRQYAAHVDEAKGSETRRRRAGKMIKLILEQAGDRG